MMRRGNPAKKNHGAPPADLLVCFPTLKPKQICSPARLSDPTIHGSHLNKLSSTRLGAGISSPVLWDKDKNVVSDASEPSSPKVTCAGQIKVRRTSATASRKSWQSVMEEIERIHIKNKKQKSRASWGDALGFLNCLRSIKLDFRCFRAMPECDISSDEDEIDNLNDKEDKSSGNKWFMYLQENQDTIEPVATQNDKETDSLSAAPPPNALLLMRCRSAPAKSWLENRARAIVEQEERDKKTQQQQQQQNEEEETEEKQRLSDYLVVMEYDTDFYKLSNDIAKETWVVGSINPNNPFPKSRSWKR